MKLLNIFTLLLAALVSYSSAQRCIATLRPPSCIGPRNVGRGGRGCNPRLMWYYDGRARQCRQMRYLGCGGNTNLWCQRATCERRCRRR
ncbi:kappaPI-actitoxin-Avd3c-like [Lucilia cuprina]|uniref:kappaPI-actitoxin-Avd3c-like n=1 Tax=Lucilia cuprina TaxID=7375 RepID=UPI001F056017|nr:kappaPI-actitoxin-Avd3c-like [Lucilia cuprina]